MCRTDLLLHVVDGKTQQVYDPDEVIGLIDGNLREALLIDSVSVSACQADNLAQLSIFLLALPQPSQYVDLLTNFIIKALSLS